MFIFLVSKLASKYALMAWLSGTSRERILLASRRQISTHRKVRNNKKKPVLHFSKTLKTRAMSSDIQSKRRSP